MDFDKLCREEFEIISTLFDFADWFIGLHWTSRPDKPKLPELENWEFKVFQMLASYELVFIVEDNIEGNENQINRLRKIVETRWLVDRPQDHRNPVVRRDALKGKDLFALILIAGLVHKYLDDGNHDVYNHGTSAFEAAFSVLQYYGLMDFVKSTLGRWTPSGRQAIGFARTVNYHQMDDLSFGEEK
jgi:hypothetical protein